MHGQIRSRSYDDIIKMHETPTRFYWRRKLGSNTYSTLDVITRVITIRYHRTDVVRLAPDGQTEIYMGGWPTVTTRQRINAYIGAWSVYQKSHAQILHSYYRQVAGEPPLVIDPYTHYILDGNEITEGRID